MWKWLKAFWWQQRAEQLFDEGYGDCDRVSLKVIKEMQVKGLKLSKDFVAVRGIAGKGMHMCIEMWGKNETYKDGKNIYSKINGYRVDGTALCLKMTKVTKGRYGD